MKDVLILGPEGSGKTLLVKRLLHCSAGTELLEAATTTLPMSTIPTAGVEMIPMKLSAVSQERQNEEEVVLREIGSALASMWPSYFDDSSAIVFVVDAADLGSLPAALTLLHEILVHSPTLLAENKLLIALSKLDVSDEYTVAAMKNIMRLSELVAGGAQVVLGSSNDTSLATKVHSWILSLHRRKDVGTPTPS